MNERFQEAQITVLIYSADDAGNLVNLFCKDESFLERLAEILKTDKISVEGPNNYIGTPALTIAQTNGKNIKIT